jgi:tripartite-type tricarboxylate transporter receptor subunit TctC
MRPCKTFAIAALLCACAAQGAEPAYPSRPIRMLVGFSAGGGSDFAARIAAQKIGEQLGQTVVVDNRTGANGAIAAEMAARSQPDGYTLIMLAVAHLVANAFDGNKLPYDVLRDFEAVSQATQQPYLAVVPASLPVRTLQEFIDLARAKPGQLNFASTGAGGSNHLAAELFNVTAKVKLGHVPYKGPPQALTDIVGGHVQFMIASIQTSLPLARSGKLKGLGVTSRERSAAAPDIPPIADTLPGFVSIGWYGVLAPKGTPRAVVDRLAGAMAKGMQTPEVRARVATDGSEVVAGTPEEFDRHLRAELDRFRRIIRDAGIKAQ